MAANVLHSPTAVRASIRVVRAFVRLREMLPAHQDLAAKIDALEKGFQEHDATIDQIFEAIRELMEPKAIPPDRQIGFVRGRRKI